MERMMQTLLEITLYSAVLFVGILLLKGLCGRSMSPALHYALWLVLLARLVIPATIDSGFSVFTLPESAAPIVADAGVETIWDLPIVQPQGQAGNGTAIANEAVNPPSANAPQETQRASTRPTWAQIGFGVWLAGMVGCLAWLGVLYAALRRRIRKNAALPGKKLLALLEEVKRELGIKSNIRLLCLYEYGTPALLFPNMLLMPVDALTAMNTAEVKLALRHELTHFKRGDQCMNLLLSLLNAIYWFNPIVWIAFRLMREDMETACDSKVTQRLNGTEKNAYANLILSLFSRPAHRQIVLGMAQSSTRRIAERRIRGIFMRKSSKPAVKLVSIVTVLILAASCFTTACVPKAKDKSISIIGGADGPTSVFVSSPSNNEDASAAAATPVQTLPEGSGKWQAQWTSGAHRIEVDADVIVPDLQNAKTLTLAPRTFQVDDIARFLAIFFGGQDVKNFNPTTKSDWEALLAEEQELLAALEAGNAPEDDLRPIDEQMASCKERMESIALAISSADENEISDAALRLDMLPRSAYESSAEFYCEITNGREYRMTVSQTTGIGSLLWYGEKDYAFRRVDAADVKARAMPDLAAAKALAQDCMAQLGIADCALSSQSLVQNGDRYAYSLSYTRSYSAMTYVDIQAVPSGLDSTKPQEDTVWIFHESFSFVSDGTSVMWAEWRYPFNVLDTQESGASLMTAEQAKEQAKAVLSAHMAKYDESDALTLVITQLRLGGCYVPGAASNRYAYVPTWEAIGYLCRSDGSRYLGEAAHPLSMVTLHAVDGSVVNKALVN